MTTCRLPALAFTALLLGVATAAAQEPATSLAPPPALLQPGRTLPAPATASSAPLPDVPRPILREWIFRVERDSTVWAQCLRGSVSERQEIVVTAVVEAVGQRVESGALRYGCPAGSIGSVHSFTPGGKETCAASDQERDAFFGGWEQVRVLVCPGPHLLWLVRPVKRAGSARTEAALPPAPPLTRAA